MQDLELMAQANADIEFVNSLGGLCDQISSQNPFSQYPGVQLSQTDTLFNNNRWYLISNLRQLLSQLYVEHGIVQTLVDQPVDDAHRAGYEVKTNQIDSNDIETLKIYDERNGVTRALAYAQKMARLYGGGAVLIITDQPSYTPLDIKKINPKTQLEFRGVDLWELYFTYQNTIGEWNVGGNIGAMSGDFYDYYGVQVHKSRVFRVLGREAPSFIRPRLRGWAMSELERLVRSLNQYMKNQDVIFELLDEAKVDIYQIKGFNSSLLNKGGTSQTALRLQAANAIKDFNNAIVMDVEDKYEQKQITFAGLAEVLIQIRQGIAADLKMPVTKLFGISAAGFNSGEDDIENYNSMIEGEIRSKNKFTHVDLLMIACQKVFGFMPDDLMIEYPSLRMLNAKEEEEVKDSQFNRVMSVYQSGLVESEEAKEAINKDSLLPIEIDVTKPAADPLGGDFTVQGAAKGAVGKKTPSED